MNHWMSLTFLTSAVLHTSFSKMPFWKYWFKKKIFDLLKKCELFWNCPFFWKVWHSFPNACLLYLSLWETRKKEHLLEFFELNNLPYISYVYIKLCINQIKIEVFIASKSLVVSLCAEKNLTDYILQTNRNKIYVPYFFLFICTK